MDVVFGDAKYEFAMAYIHDIVVFSRTFEEHLVHLHIILERMRQAGLTIHPGKAQLAVPEIKLLGLVVDRGALRAYEYKLREITEYTTSRDVKALQRYLGKIAFCRVFIPRCAEITAPLNQLLRKKTKWCWGEQQQIAFATLSKAVTDNAYLHLRDLNRPFTLQTDASDYGLGAVLLQEYDTLLRPVAFASHTLTGAERNYFTPKKECLTIIFFHKKV